MGVSSSSGLNPTPHKFIPSVAAIRIPILPSIILPLTRAISMITLLYTEKGMEEAGNIWAAFETARHEYEQVADEDREAAEAEELWRYGEPEEAEEARRNLNGEYELAIRGYRE